MLMHGTCLLPVSFPRSCSVSNPIFWGELPLGVDACNAEPFLCLGLVVWVSWVSSVVDSHLILYELVVHRDVSWGCCQKTSEIDGSVVYLFVWAVPVGIPEWRRNVLRLNVKLQARQPKLHFPTRLVVGFVSVLPVLCSKKRFACRIGS